MHPNLFCVPQLRSQMRIHAWPNGGCRWRRRGSLTTSLCGSEWVCVCVCVRASDVRRSEARKHHQPEPGFSHTVASTFCSASCVYTARCSAVRPQPMIWKSGAIELHNMKFQNTGGMCLYSVFIKLWYTCLLKKNNTLCFLLHYPY